MFIWLTDWQRHILRDQSTLLLCPRLTDPLGYKSVEGCLSLSNSLFIGVMCPNPKECCCVLPEPLVQVGGGEFEKPGNELDEALGLSVPSELEDNSDPGAQEVSLRVDVSV